MPRFRANQTRPTPLRPAVTPLLDHGRRCASCERAIEVGRPASRLCRECDRAQDRARRPTRNRRPATDAQLARGVSTDLRGTREEIIERYGSTQAAKARFQIR